MKIFTSFGYLSLSGVELLWYSNSITGVFWTYWYFFFQKRKEKRLGMYLRGIDTYWIHEYEQKWNIRASQILLMNIIKSDIITFKSFIIQHLTTHQPKKRNSNNNNKALIPKIWGWYGSWISTDQSRSATCTLFRCSISFEVILSPISLIDMTFFIFYFYILHIRTTFIGKNHHSQLPNLIPAMIPKH